MDMNKIAIDNLISFFAKTILSLIIPLSSIFLLILITLLSNQE